MTGRCSGFVAAALLASGILALPVRASEERMQPGRLVVHNDANVFSDAGIEAAKKRMGEALFDRGLTLTIDTVKDVPEGRRAELKQKGEKAFFRDWARERAKDERAKGVFVLVCRSPAYVYVEAGDKTAALGFTPDDEKKLHDILLKSFADSRDKPDAEALAVRDAGLKAAVDFVAKDLEGKLAPESATAAQTPTQTKPQPTGLGLGGWLCIGLFALLGAWLVIGIIRAVSGGVSTGGGFLGMLLGGMFGAAAGLWLYNSFFSSGGMFGGNDAYAGGGDDFGGGGDFGGGDDFGGSDGAGGGFDGGGDF